MGEATRTVCNELIGRVSYKGNSEHKKHPNDYGLTPPTNPRPGKALCDAQGSFPKADAEKLLNNGVARLMVSVQRRNGWPQNIWAVNENNEAFESQLENSELGHYHGYPMPADDDFQQIVLREWEKRKHVAGN